MSYERMRKRQLRAKRILGGWWSAETHVVTRAGIGAVRDLQVSVVERDCMDANEHLVVAGLRDLCVLDEGENIKRAGALEAVLGMRGWDIDHGVSIDIAESREEQGSSRALVVDDCSEDLLSCLIATSDMC